MKRRSKPRKRITEASLLLAALALAVLSATLAEDQKRYEEVAARALPARATLRSVEVKEWISGRGNWGAFGMFDVVADGPRGTLEGDLAPAERGRAANRSRAKAESYLQHWKIGETYDGFWNPDRPLTVFFIKPDPAGNARWVLVLQVLSAVLFLAAVLWYVRRRRV